LSVGPGYHGIESQREVQRKTPSANGTEYLRHTGLVLRNSTALAPGSPVRATQKQLCLPERPERDAR
jgi:hypothetical protein